MEKRWTYIWFPHLLADWCLRKQPALTHTPFVLAIPVQGRMVVKAVSEKAQKAGIVQGMVVADCKAVLPHLEILNWEEGKEHKILTAIGEWCIRFSPVVAADPPDGLVIDTTGCAHLWGGEKKYLQDIEQKFSALSYHVQTAIAGTAGTARALARFGPPLSIVPPGKEKQALLPLPPASLKLDIAVLDRLSRLGMHTIQSFIDIPGAALRRRFGQVFLQTLHQALGLAPEFIQPLQPVTPYFQHLPCIEPVHTAKAIKIALEQLLKELCGRLKKEEKGLRSCLFTTYRTDGKQQQLRISTGQPTVSVQHLMKLLEPRISSVEPEPGIELFTLEAPHIMPLPTLQNVIWKTSTEQDEIKLAELLDTISNRVGAENIYYSQPAEHYWPERSFQTSVFSTKKKILPWPEQFPRPLQLLDNPIRIEVMVPLPDYPPVSFRLQGKWHKVKKADGPERIEQEWWIQQGHYRDYYYVENEEGARYWIFRLGHYHNHQPQWFVHGFFA